MSRKSRWLFRIRGMHYARLMNAIVDPDGPKFAVLETNPAPEGLRGGYFSTPDRLKLRYATFPKTAGAPKGTVCLVQGRTEFVETTQFGTFSFRYCKQSDLPDPWNTIDLRASGLSQHGP